MTPEAELLTTIRTRFPKAFPREPVPLAVGVHKALREQLADLLGPGKAYPYKALSRVLSAYCNHPDYLQAVIQGDRRVTLTGDEAAAVTDKDKAYATRRREEQRNRTPKPKPPVQPKLKTKPEPPVQPKLKTKPELPVQPKLKPEPLEVNPKTGRKILRLRKT